MLCEDSGPQPALSHSHARTHTSFWLAGNKHGNSGSKNRGPGALFNLHLQAHSPALTSTQNSKSTSKTKRDYAEILKEIQDLKIFYLLNVKVNFVSYCDMKTL